MEVRPGYKQTEVGMIPEDWGVHTIGSVVSISVGRDLREENYSTHQTNRYRFPVFSNTIANRGTYGFYDFPEYKGDSLTIVGRGVGLGTAFKRSGGFGAIGRLLVLFPQKGADAAFLAEYINHRVTIFVESGGIPQLTGLSIAKYRVPLPPSRIEQEAIAGALSDADALIESLEQLLVKKRQIRQGVMQDLLTGKIRLPGFCEHWELKRLGDTAEFKKGKGLPKSALSPFGAHACIHYGELFTRYPETIQSIISRTDHSDDCVRSIANDVLMPTSDVTPGGLAKASCLLEDGVILGGDILIIRSNKAKILGSFLSYVIRFEERQILNLVSGTTVFHLYPSDMRKFVFSVPPLKEQHAIVSILQDIDAEIRFLAQKLGKVRQQKYGMTQELLTGKTRLV